MSEVIIKFLDKYIDKSVVVRLKNHKSLRGNLQSFDEHLNLVLENSVYITEEKEKSLGTIILRGDNIHLISLPTP